MTVHATLRTMAAACALLSMAPAIAQQGSMSEIEGADATIFVDNGHYYMSYTAHPGGFPILTSDDLRVWRAPDGNRQQLALKAGESFGSRYFFAPQFLARPGGGYLMAYSADLSVAIADADNVTGPYRQENFGNVAIAGAQNIDQFLFQDDNGKWYLYYAHYVQESNMKGNTIRVAEFDIAHRQIVAGTDRECLRAPATSGTSWENTSSNAWTGNATVEGPGVTKIDGTYYLFYTANDYQCIDYAVGYATAPTPTGPWTRHSGNPIISRSTVGENGAGHGEFFFGTDGKPYYIYHVHGSSSSVQPRKLRIVPLSMTRDSNGTYNFSASAADVIVPRMQYVPGTAGSSFPPAIYAVGTTEGQTWDVNAATWPLYGDGTGHYSGKVKLWAADGNAQLALFPTPGSWAGRIAPRNDHEVLTPGQLSASVASDSPEHCWFLPEGEYNIEVDLVNNTIAIFPPTLYAVGLLGNAWDSATLWNFTNTSYSFLYAGNGCYRGYLRTWAPDGVNSQLALIDAPGSNARYAPATDHELLGVHSAPASLRYGVSENCWFLPPGEFDMSVDLLAGTATINPTALYAIGTLDGMTWDINNGTYRLDHLGDGVYTGTINAWETGGAAQLALFSALGTYDQDRYAPATDHTRLNPGVADATMRCANNGNCWFLPGGEWHVTADIHAGTMRLHYPDNLYAVGTMDATTAWDIATPAYAMEHTGDGHYTGRIKVWPSYDSNSKAQLAFVSRLTDNWGTIGKYRYGPPVDHTALAHGTSAALSRVDGTCYLLDAGTYDVDINLPGSSVSLRRVSPAEETGVEDAVALIPPAITPNPATSTATISAAEPLGQVTVYTLTGTPALTMHTPATSLTVDVSALPAGLYIVHTDAGTARLIKR